MDVTIVLGPPSLAKAAAVEGAIAASPVDPRSIELFALDPVSDLGSRSFHENPDYAVRAGTQRLEWKQALRALRASPARYVVLMASAYSDTSAGLELTLPLDVFRLLAQHIKRSAGTLELVCLIDDAFAAPSGNTDLPRRLLVRQLEWTFTRYLSTQVPGSFSSDVHCYALHHPQRNLVNVLTRQQVPAVYLCYPVNFFRREPAHPLRAELDGFRRSVALSGVTVHDPLGIDEEVLISPNLGVRDAHSLKIRPTDRWRSPYPVLLFDSEPELMSTAEGIVVSPPPGSAVSRMAKAQVPQRDFFWIESSDTVISWRPFLGGSHHAGVQAELQFALHKNKPIVAYSPPEDGGEHPSPFAAMISTVEDPAEFARAVSDVASQPSQRRAPAVDSPPKYCDHTSVGVLIHDSDGRLLLIERGTFPFGMAAPAGHVDEHSSYEEAAVAEVREEVGLEVNDIRLVAEGRRENPCRRVNGTWHYWKIYEATATGDLALSEREAKRAEWCDRKRLIELGLVTGDHETEPGIERVWLDWLNELKILPH